MDVGQQQDGVRGEKSLNHLFSPSLWGALAEFEALMRHAGAYPTNPGLQHLSIRLSDYPSRQRRQK